MNIYLYLQRIIMSKKKNIFIGKQKYEELKNQDFDGYFI